MGKNRNYRDYSKKFDSEKEEETKVEEVVEETIIEEPKEEAYVKEEIDTKGLDANTFANDYPKGKIKCKDKLRVRTSMDAKDNKNVLGLFDNGTEVTILEDLGEWLSIEISKNSIKSRGFVMSKFIER